MGLLVLTAVSGIVDAISFLGLGHVFTANMTGNVAFLAFAVAGIPGVSGRPLERLAGGIHERRGARAATSVGASRVRFAAAGCSCAARASASLLVAAAVAAIVLRRRLHRARGSRICLDRIDRVRNGASERERVQQLAATGSHVDRRA
jgi:hypothetical protein